jgi:hypothetical protein
MVRPLASRPHDDSTAQIVARLTSGLRQWTCDAPRTAMVIWSAALALLLVPTLAACSVTTAGTAGVLAVLDQRQTPPAPPPRGRPSLPRR